MEKEPKAEMPKVKLATEDWVLKELMDTERRIEKAFHDQTQYIGERMTYLGDKLNTQTRWMVGLIVTMTIAILLAVLFQ